MRKCGNQMEEENKVTVSVDVTKIVKYCCMAAVMIVGTIFGTTAFMKLLEKQEKDC